jgi:hypothetical protein
MTEQTKKEKSKNSGVSAPVLRKRELTKLILQTQEQFAETLRTDGKNMHPNDIIIILDWLAKNP